MTPEQIQQLVEKLLSSGQFLASEAFRISMRQVTVVSRIEAFWGIILLLIAIIELVFLYNFVKKAKAHNLRRRTDEKFNYDTYDIDLEESKFFWTSITISFFSTLFSIILLTNTAMYSMNPEWYAVRWMLDSLIK